MDGKDIAKLLLGLVGSGSSNQDSTVKGEVSKENENVSEKSPVHAKTSSSTTATAILSTNAIATNVVLSQSFTTGITTTTNVNPTTTAPSLITNIITTSLPISTGTVNENDHSTKEKVGESITSSTTGINSGTTIIETPIATTIGTSTTTIIEAGTTVTATIGTSTTVTTTIGIGTTTTTTGTTATPIIGAIETPKPIATVVPTLIPVTNAESSVTDKIKSNIKVATKIVEKSIKAISTTTIVPSVSTIPSSINPMASISTPNLNGFEDGNWYKVRSVGDNNVIQVDISSNKLICSPNSDENLDLQLFRAAEQPNGTYRIVAKKQKSPDNPQDALVWDYLPHRELLMQRKQSSSNKFTQNWSSNPVPGYNSMYLVQPDAPSDTQEDIKCLKNMGSGEQIKLVKKDDASIADHFSHWYLELQDSVT